VSYLETSNENDNKKLGEHECAENRINFNEYDEEG